MKRRLQAIVLAAAAVLGVAYVFITPPLEVPDETYHFWRPLFIAGGQLMPQHRAGPDSGTIPLGAQNLAYIMFTQKTGQGKYTRAQMRLAWQLGAGLDRPKLVRFPNWYTPVPYIPQTLAAGLLQWFGVRPLLVFYLGRLFNLAVALVLMALAMRAAPDFAAPLAAVTLLPMTMAQFSSWSADALTIALAALLTALLLGERAPRATIAVAFLLALCKPAYFLIALLVLATRYRPAIKAAIAGASAAGTALSMAYASIGAYAQRMFDPVNPAAQMRCVLSDPMRFVRAVAHDIPLNWRTYVEQLVGRFGGLVQVWMPAWFVMVEVALLIGVALTGRAKARALSLLIVASSVVGILLSQFLIWSIACGETIDGVQGRYFLPLLPLALTLPAIRRPRNGAAGFSRPAEAGHYTVIAIAVVCNAIALLHIARQFWL